MNNIESFKIGGQTVDSSSFFPIRNSDRDLLIDAPGPYGGPTPACEAIENYYQQPHCRARPHISLNNQGQHAFCINVEEDLILRQGFAAIQEPREIAHLSPRDALTGLIPIVGDRVSAHVSEALYDEMWERRGELMDQNVYWNDDQVQEYYMTQLGGGIGDPAYWIGFSEALDESSRNRLCFEPYTDEWKCAYLDGGFNSDLMNQQQCLQKCIDNIDCRAWEFDIITPPPAPAAEPESAESEPESAESEPESAESLGKCTLFRKEPGIWSGGGTISGVENQRCYYPHNWENTDQFAEWVESASISETERATYGGILGGQGRTGTIEEQAFESASEAGILRAELDLDGDGEMTDDELEEYLERRGNEDALWDYQQAQMGIDAGDRTSLGDSTEEDDDKIQNIFIYIFIFGILCFCFVVLVLFFMMIIFIFLQQSNKSKDL
tara:strand:- start:1006 stop:2322 length:1317 start_codon:yes stop_codon:yes gene_type:complete